MAQMYFYYSAMNAGKSTTLLQSSFNYKERGMETKLFTFEAANRQGDGFIESRVGLKEKAVKFNQYTNFMDKVKLNEKLDCILVDEAQFLTKEQVMQLARFVDDLNIPVLCYGLRTDFRGELFEGSAALLAHADKLVELKGMCHCGRKATHVLKHGGSDSQVEIGGNSLYESVCRKHFFG